MKADGLRKPGFQNLIQHLVDLEDNRNRLVREYYPEPSPQRIEFEKLLDDYIIQLEAIVKSAGITKRAGGFVPIVIVDSEVEVEDMDSGDTFDLRIIYPFDDRSEGAGVSFLSPVGEALLCKGVGDEVVVDAPGGIFHYRIKSIKWPFAGEATSIS